jgi:hypothetical protein
MMSSPNDQTPPPAETPPPPPPPPPAGPAAGEDAVDETGAKLGFPAKTPVAEMNPQQQAAYWRNQAKVQQKIAEQRKDYDEQAAAAAKWRAYESEQQTPSQKAIEEAKLEAKKEVAGETALASLATILQNRGKDESEVSDLLEFVSSDRLLTSDGKVDRQKVAAIADKLAPSGSQSGSGGGYGQGRYEQPPVSRSAAGIAEAERRFGKKS